MDIVREEIERRLDAEAETAARGAARTDLAALRQFAADYAVDGFRDAGRAMTEAADEIEALRALVANVTRALGYETPLPDADLVAHAAWCRAEVARQGAEIALLRAACAATQAEARAPWGDRSAWAAKLAALTAAGYAP